MGRTLSAYGHLRLPVTSDAVAVGEVSAEITVHPDELSLRPVDVAKRNPRPEGARPLIGLLIPIAVVDVAGRASSRGQPVPPEGVVFLAYLHHSG